MVLGASVISGRDGRLVTCEQIRGREDLGVEVLHRTGISAAAHQNARVGQQERRRVVQTGCAVAA